MKTRRNRNLQNTNIHELMMPDAPKHKKKIVIKSKRQSNQIGYQIGYQTRGESFQTKLNHTLGNVCIFDTESFRFKMEQGEKLLIMQLAYVIIDYSNPQRPKQLRERTIYNASVLVIETYRKQLIQNEFFTKKGHERHEQNWRTNDCRYMPAAKMINKFIADLLNFDVKTIVGFNMGWDLEALRDTVKHFDPRNKVYKLNKTVNPLDMPCFKFCDMMYNAFHIFKEGLVKHGLRRKTINHKGFKTRKRGSGVYSLEFITHYLTGTSNPQKHLALSDALDTKLVLDECLKRFNFDPSNLEYNLWYTDKLFVKVQKLAPQLYESIAWVTVEASKEGVCCECKTTIEVGANCMFNQVSQKKKCVRCR